jgi:hypothetical protein
MRAIWLATTLAIVCMSARSEQTPLAVYDRDPEHLWNRLYRAIAVRTEGAVDYGLDNAEPYHDAFDDMRRRDIVAGRAGGFHSVTQDENEYQLTTVPMGGTREAHLRIVPSMKYRPRSCAFDSTRMSRPHAGPKPPRPRVRRYGHAPL